MSDRPGYTVIVNPAAGRGRAVRHLPRLAAALGAGDLDVDLRVSRHPAEPVALAHAAFDTGRVVVAAGGDGLLGQLAAVAHERAGTLGLIPLGSGNDTARALGYDHGDPVAAVDALRRGATVRMDLARADAAGEARILCSVAASGFDSEANRWANTVRRLSGSALYVAAVLRTLATYRPHRFRLALDDDVHEVEAWLVAVANTPNYAGGMHIAPAARVDDGILDVTVVGPLSRPAFLRAFPSVYQGTHVEHPAVTTHRARRVHLESRDPTVPIESYADGERIGPLPTTITVLPAALSIVVPGRAPDGRPPGVAGPPPA
jgi:diacylglycerol kinase (ATP)